MGFTACFCGCVCARVFIWLVGVVDVVLQEEGGWWEGGMVEREGRHGDRNRKKTEKWVEMGGKIGKAIKAYLSAGIFMTGSYEGMGVRAAHCFDSSNFVHSISFFLFVCFISLSGFDFFFFSLSSCL